MGRKRAIEIDFADELFIQRLKSILILMDWVICMLLQKGKADI
jgi:hypothetical protein